MKRIYAIFSVVALFSLPQGSEAQEMRPFHTTQFPDDTSVSLAILMSSASADLQFDYDVEVELTEHGPAGKATFIDDGHHHVRVRCQEPKAVKVGGVLYPLDAKAPVDDWKQDLWKSLCLQPVS